ncbi:hypothetical protein CEJ83_20780 [Acinetobacter baumannii]|nr:hypothetical protein CEJ83_20780 [Acinetobacter baumannii]
MRRTGQDWTKPSTKLIIIGPDTDMAMDINMVMARDTDTVDMDITASLAMEVTPDTVLMELKPKMEGTK